ncbi:MAG: 1-deoxy-D-xylulose-5-phosphate reductoisomerase, partial [Synechococcus sp.]|nr:1-deoxy-D-xylulose-5-phosphate reductoisomerase [Synechococcus sp.]
MNAANEQAVALFLEEQVHFLDIPKLIDVVCERHKADLTASPSLSDVLAVDAWARQAVREAAARLNATVQAKAPAALPA